MKPCIWIGLISGLLGITLGLFGFPPRQPAGGDINHPEQTDDIEYPLVARTLPPANEPDQRAGADGPDSGLAALQDQLASLQEENRSLQDRLANSENKQPEGKPVVVIPKNLVSKLRVKTIDQDGHLETDVIEILDIQPEEQAQMESAFLDAREQLDKLESAHASVLSEPGQFIKIDISPYSSEGQAVEDRLRANLRSCLGEERAMLFGDLTGYLSTWGDRFSLFGQAQQTFTAEKEPSGRIRVESSWELVNRSSRRKRDGIARSTRGSYSTTRSSDNVPENFQSLIPKTMRHLLKTDGLTQ